MSPNRISGDDFAVTGDLASKLCIMCKECVAPTFGAHVKEKVDFQCYAFDFKRVAQTIYKYRYIMMMRGLGKTYKSVIKFDNILSKTSKRYIHLSSLSIVVPTYQL
jgi:hypothetical protein